MKLTDTPYYNAILVGIILLSSFIVSRLIRVVLSRFLRRSADKLNVDKTNYNFIKNAMNFIIFTIALVMIFSVVDELKDIGKGLFVSAGIIAAIVGFASQQAFSNIVSGIFIVIFKPFRVNDFIKLSDLNFGVIEDITLRHTVIRNTENRRVIIPNSVISNETIVNSNIVDEKVCVHLELGIGYSANIDKAIDLIQEEALKHPNCVDNRDEEKREKSAPVVVVRVVAWADSSINLRAYVWANSNGEAFEMKCDLLKSIKERFDAEGIEIPFPHRVLINR